MTNTRYNKCDCGGEKAKSTHAHWCDSHNEDFSIEAFLDSVSNTVDENANNNPFNLDSPVAHTWACGKLVDPAKGYSDSIQWKVITDDNGREIGRLFIAYT